MFPLPCLENNMVSNSIGHTLTHIDHSITAIHCQLRLPGLAVAIVQDHEIIYQRSFGEAAPSRPTTPDTPFILGSLSKSFTALAIMQLVEDGKLDLDERVQHYIPWFHLRDVTMSSLITVRHLLTHTSGISRFAGRVLLSGHGGKTREQSVRELSTVQLLHPVGSHFAYSNTNYLIAGLLVEIVSDMSYEEYIQEHIFQPLQMTNSFTSEHQARRHRMAQGHRWWFGRPVPFDAPFLEDALPAAYILSSSQDMARYLVACLDAGVSGGSLLSPQGFAEIFRPQAPVPSKDASYGLGWRIEHVGDELIIRHGGEVSNFRADMVLLPGRKLGVVVLANCNNGMIAQLGLDQIAMNVVRLLISQPLPRKRLTFRSFYALVDLLMVAISLMQVGSLVQLLRSPSRRPVRIGSLLALLGDVIGPLMLLWRLPKWSDMSWRGMLLYVPDISRWLVGMVLVSLVKSCVRVYGWLQIRSSRLPSH